MAVNKVAVAVAVSGLLFFGCINTLVTKIQFTIRSDGSEEHNKQFQKPWFVNFLMFIAMSIALIAYTIQEARARSSNQALDKLKMLDSSPGSTGASLLQKPADPKAVTGFKAFLYISAPSVCDLIASGLGRVGLLYMPASIWQMLRGSMIVFSAFISVPVLGRKLNGHHWLGVFIACIGVTLVGYANILNSSAEVTSGKAPQYPVNEVLLGTALVVAGQVVQASQLVVEEKLLKDVKLPPLQVVGYEGVWGMTLAVCIMFPLCYILHGSDNGHVEDIGDTVVMIKNSSTIQAMICLYIVSVASFNISGMFVTSQLSAVHRTMLEATRTLVIWMFCLGTYYVDSSISFGEAWLPYSPLQAGGFVVLLFGQCVYNALLKLPGFYYPPPVAPAAWESPVSVRELASPLPPIVMGGNDVVDDINVDQ